MMKNTHLLNGIYVVGAHWNCLYEATQICTNNITGVIPISLFLLATGTVLHKAAIDRGVRLATGRYGCRQINKPSNSTVSVLRISSDKASNLPKRNVRFILLKLRLEKLGTFNKYI